jgi:tripartite-type tricarboxylate transporter receptor subunit TctC
VPYKGAAPATADLIGGQVPSGILGAAPLIPHLQAGRIRAIAVTTENRTASLPEVPTLAEVGVKGFTSSQWFGFLAPTGTPREVIMKINSDVLKVLAAPDVKEKLATQGGETHGTTPEAFGAFMKKEYDTYAQIIAQAGIKVE